MPELPEQIEFWHWWVLGVLLVGLEVFAPSTVFLWPGIAAGIVGLILLMQGDLSWQVQCLIFAVLSIGGIVTLIEGWRQRTTMKPFQVAALAQFHTMKTSVRNRLNVDRLSK